jgi:uncharacterized damage-inducible protein DinB
MTWIAPQVTRTEESFVADERGMLEGILERHRETLLWKCSGLSGEQLAVQPVAASSLSLLGIVRHMAETERAWFRGRFRGERLPKLYDDRPDAAFDEADPSGAEEAFLRLTGEWDLSREAVAGASLDDQFTHERGMRMSLRWVFHHMIEEYARHNGHADLLRESIDGMTGE